jgi:SAM-dependent methyltransferase
MAWDPVWEKIFRKRGDWGKYPPEELVRFIARNYYSVPDRRNIRILEVGCGPGGGPSWYVSREGFTYAGVDGSGTAIERAKNCFQAESLMGEFKRSMFDDLPWQDGSFDSVIDVASLQCNDQASTAGILAEIRRVLKDEGTHFSLTAKSGCWGDGTGIRIDATSYRDIQEGPYKGMGVIRFATRASLMHLYAGFRDVELEYSIRSVRQGTKEISNWIVTCKK